MSINISSKRAMAAIAAVSALAGTLVSGSAVNAEETVCDNTVYSQYDCNRDGMENVADLVTLRNHLLNEFGYDDLKIKREEKIYEYLKTLPEYFIAAENITYERISGNCAVARVTFSIPLTVEAYRAYQIDVQNSEFYEQALSENRVYYIGFAFVDDEVINVAPMLY